MKFWITDIELKTARNGARYMTYTIQVLGEQRRGCSFIPKNITSENHAAAWLRNSINKSNRAAKLAPIIAEVAAECVEQLRDEAGVVTTADVVSAWIKTLRFADSTVNDVWMAVQDNSDELLAHLAA